jgi:ribosome-binding factor A
VNLKYAPDLRFRVDESFDEAERIDALLDTEAVRRDTRSSASGSTRITKTSP